MDDEQTVNQIYTDPKLLTPYTRSVKTRGAVNPNTQKPVDTGFFSVVGAKIKEDNVVSNIWRWGRLQIARRWGEPAPVGWDPANEISGFFNNYRDYLMEAENPQELELRKNYVISRINYERIVNEIGWTKGVLTSIAGLLVDPATYLLGGIAGKFGGFAAKSAAKLGLTRIGSGVLRGAVEGEIVGLGETAIKRSLNGAQVVEPEYNVITNMLFGSAIGGLGGLLSESAGFAKFSRQTRNSNFELYRAAELEKRRLELGIYKDLTNEERIDRRAFIDAQIKKYVNGEIDSNKFRWFNISSISDKEKELAKNLGVWGIATRHPAKNIASVMNWVRARYSNQFNLLGCELESLREAGNRIFPVSTFENDILERIGDTEPLTIKVARKNGIVFSKIENGLKDGYKIAKGNGFQGSRANFEEHVYEIMRDQATRSAETNPGVLQAVESVNGGLREAADWLYSVHGFEWQVQRDAKFKSDVDALITQAKESGISEEYIKSPLKPGENAEKVSDLRAQYLRLKADYDADMTGGLDKALESFGGSYTPIFLDGSKIQLDMKNARAAIRKSMVAGESEYYQRRIASKIEECVDSVIRRNEPLTWENIEWELTRFGLEGKFKNPYSNENISAIELINDAKNGRLEFNNKFFDSIDEDVERRINYAIDSEHQLISGFDKGINIHGVLDRAQEAPEKAPRGSARRRTYHDKIEYLEGYINDDFHKVIEQYVKTMHNSAGMIENFGDENATRFMDKIGADYVTRCKEIEESELSIDKKRQALHKLEESTNNGLKALRTSLNFVKGYGSIDWGDLGKDSLIAKTSNIITNWNVARYLSYTLFSQFQDQANVALHLNGWLTFGESLSNFTKLLYNSGYRRELKNLVHDLGIASEYHMKGTRLREMVSVARETCSVAGRIDKGMEWVADKAMRASGTEFLDGWTRANASYMTGCEIARTAEAMMKGKKLTSFQTTFLNECKLSSDLIYKIGEQIEKYGEKKNGVHRLNLADWDDKDAANHVRRVLYEHAVGATMVPGAELPALFRTPLGKILLQFHAFSTATFSKMFMYSLEGGGHRAADAIAQCLILDTFGKVCKSFGKWYGNSGVDPETGKKRKFDAFDVTMRAMQESIQSNDWITWAALDPGGIIQTMKDSYSSYGQFGGTTAGLIRDIGRGSAALVDMLTSGSASERDKRSLRRIIPFQNWFFVRAGIEGLRHFMGKTNF